MLFGGTVGARIDLKPVDMDTPTFLFSETPSRLVVEVAPENKDAFEQTMGLLSVALIGKTIKKPSLVIQSGEFTLYEESVSKLKEIWKRPLSHL
jgi:phosphoribosylformylglycinamidine synthase